MKNNSTFINKAFIEKAREVSKLLDIKASLERDQINMKNFISNLRKKVNENSNSPKST